MATPIKETPVLKGNDARIFMAKINDPNKRNSISEEARKRMREGFDRINAMSLKK